MFVFFENLMNILRYIILSILTTITYLAFSNVVFASENWDKIFTDGLIELGFSKAIYVDVNLNESLRSLDDYRTTITTERLILQTSNELPPYYKFLINKMHPAYNRTVRMHNGSVVRVQIARRVLFSKSRDIELIETWSDGAIKYALANFKYDVEVLDTFPKLAVSTGPYYASGRRETEESDMTNA